MLLNEFHYMRMVKNEKNREVYDLITAIYEKDLITRNEVKEDIKNLNRILELGEIKLHSAISEIVEHRKQLTGYKG